MPLNRNIRTFLPEIELSGVGEERFDLVRYISAAFEREVDQQREEIRKKKEELLGTCPRTPGELEGAYLARLEGEVIRQHHELGVDLGSKVRLIALLFGRPYNKIVTDDIIPRLDYWHHRSGVNMDFFCVGFHRENANFDEEDFVGTVQAFEGKCQWRFSGETDLVILNARYDEADRKAVLEFSSVVSLTLERAQEDKAFGSVPAFFEQLIRFTEGYDGTDPAWGFSDAQGLRVGGSALKQLLLSLLPESLRGDAKKAFHLYIHDYRLKPQTA